MTDRCPVTGGAFVVKITGGIVWERADPEIHVDDELLEHSEARAYLEIRYRVDEPCPFMPGVRHARLKTEEADRG